MMTDDARKERYRQAGICESCLAGGQPEACTGQRFAWLRADGTTLAVRIPCGFPGRAVMTDIGPLTLHPGQTLDIGAVRE